MVNTSEHPESGTYTENWDDWSPRLGLAYRVSNGTVVRAAWGKFVVPEDLYFGGLPLDADINSLQNIVVGSINGEETPNNYQSGVNTTANTLDNPFPNGLAGPPHRNSSYQQILLGGGTQANKSSEPNGETYQWNIAVEHQLPMGIAVTAAYVGLKGDHLPIAGPGSEFAPRQRGCEGSRRSQLLYRQLRKLLPSAVGAQSVLPATLAKERWKSRR